MIWNIIKFLFALIYYKSFKVGDYVYLKPTMEKCVIIDKLLGAYWLLNMDGFLINGGNEVNKGLFVKVKDE